MAASKKRSTKAGAASVVGASGLATALVWFLGHVHVTLSAEDGSVIAGVVSTVTLFVWHTGLGNIWHHLIHGDEQVPATDPGGG